MNPPKNIPNTNFNKQSQEQMPMQNNQQTVSNNKWYKTLKFFIFLVLPLTVLFTDTKSILELTNIGNPMPLISLMLFHFLLIGIGLSIYLGLKTPFNLKTNIKVLFFYTLSTVISSSFVEMASMGSYWPFYFFIIWGNIIKATEIVLPLYLIIMLATSFLVRTFTNKKQQTSTTLNASPQDHSTNGKKTLISLDGFEKILATIIVLLFLFNGLQSIFIPNKETPESLYLKASKILNQSSSQNSYKDTQIFLQLKTQINTTLYQNPKDMHSIILVNPQENTVYRLDLIPHMEYANVVIYVPLVQYIKELNTLDARTFFTASTYYHITTVPVGYLQQPAIHVIINNNNSPNTSNYIEFAYSLKDINIRDKNKTKIYINLNTLENPFRRGSMHYHVFVQRTPENIKIIESSPYKNTYLARPNLLKPKFRGSLKKATSSYQGYDYYYLDYTPQLGTFEQPLQLAITYNNNNFSNTAPNNSQIKELEESYKLLFAYFIPSTLVSISLLPTIVASIGYFIIKRIVIISS